METTLKRRRGLSSFQIILLGFAGVILLGALLLMLPMSTQAGVFTPFGDALFTSTSAVCVTGLVVRDTASYWSPFGQAVILGLIQIGGLGVITVAACFALVSGKKISLMQRSTMQEAMAAPGVGGIVRLTLFILKVTAVLELSGALLLLPVFCRDFGARGIWMAFFHAISAFCNAGFDLMGRTDAPFQSLAAYAADPAVNTVIMLLILLGGIGFLTWEDVCTHRYHLKHYRLQSKIILVTTGCLILLPALYFFFFDFADLPFGERLLAALFQSVTPRTAGFNTADLGAMSEGSRAIMILLMLTGGSPGSTAGGMKTTTLAVLLVSAAAVFGRREDTEVFGRRVDNGVVKSAVAILIMYLSLFFLGALLISAVEGLPLSVCLFETASAVGTAGLTLGLTPLLGGLSRAVLILLMFLGRVGGLTVIFATVSPLTAKPSKLPQEKIIVG